MGRILSKKRELLSVPKTVTSYKDVEMVAKIIISNMTNDDGTIGPIRKVTYDEIINNVSKLVSSTEVGSTIHNLFPSFPPGEMNQIVAICIGDLVSNNWLVFLGDKEDLDLALEEDCPVIVGSFMPKQKLVDLITS